MRLRHFGLLVFMMLLTIPAEAFHIIGGEITYEYLGDGVFRFTMRVYRDCRNQGQNVGQLDEFAPIGIYVERDLIQVLSVPLSQQSFVEAPTYPCLVPPNNLCVEEGVYIWDYEFPGGDTDDFSVVYQRCCRNNTIINLVNPLQYGATYDLEVKSVARGLENSSPVFKEFPPTVVCVDSELSFDHSAIDRDGDSLVYSFCTPQHGGAFSTNPGNANGCASARPNPPCPGPFDLVRFASPYSALTPMAGDPVVSIDPVTGLISGKPQTIGQFVVGVCVKEYRDGILLSEIKRDFQFNVADCDPLVFAKVKSDAEVGNKEFVINSCGNNTILFENESEIERHINTYRWEFDINGITEEFNSRDALVTFPGIGEYRGVMMINPGLDCGDTAEVYVNLYPSIEADFNFVYDTCTAGPVIFNDRSSTGAREILSWEWNVGESTTLTERHPVFTYQTPGVKNVSLTVTDDNQCMDTKTVALPYFPVPPLVVVDPTTFLGCSPAPIRFDNLSVPIDSTYIILWDFGDGNSSSALSPVHIFEDPGLFSISVEITSPIGCYTEASFNDWIEVKPGPGAAFSYSPEDPTNVNPHVDFRNLSFDHIDQQWFFGAQGRSMENHPGYTFPDTGIYDVALIAYHENGCTDTVIQQVHILPRVTFHMPNAFTPNGDGRNDVFAGQGYLAGMQDFELSIWDRWGALLFVTENPEDGWDGSRQNAGETLPGGVYIYQVYYVDPMGEEINLKGFATLIR